MFIIISSAAIYCAFSPDLNLLSSCVGICVAGENHPRVSAEQ